MNSSLHLYRQLPRHDSTRASAVTIGNFDGVHRGHQAILQQVHAHARQHGLEPTVMTFHPHPRAYFARRGKRPELIPTQISSLRDKVTRLHACGMRQIVILKFAQALADMPAEDFVRHLLVQGLNTRWLLVGEDFRFGHKRSGDIELLRRLGKTQGFQVQTLDNVTDDQGQRISSSALRTALAVGDTTRAAAMLGGAYRISGHVVHGRKLGRSLGYPTLNLLVAEPCAARSGIYVVRVFGLDAEPLAGVASLGVRPSIAADGQLLLETHILDRDVQAYGKLVCVELLEFLRDEETFPDLASLSAAIGQDVDCAHHYFASHGL